jgi:hypothetical protein
VHKRCSRCHISKVGGSKKDGKFIHRIIIYGAFMTSKPKKSDDTLHENYHEKDEKNALLS